MAAAYHRAFESKHFYFHTGRPRRRISRCAGKRHIVIAEIRDGRDQFQPRLRQQSNRRSRRRRFRTLQCMENEDSDWSFKVTVTMEF